MVYRSPSERFEKNETMERARLTYFDMRGRAEAIRLLLHATQTEFEDQRIVSSDEWAALKPTLPFGALPIYESQRLRLCQSHAILRHLGRQLSSADQDEGNAAELAIAQEAIAAVPRRRARQHGILPRHDARLRPCGRRRLLRTGNHL